MTHKFLPAKLTWLIVTTILLLASGKEARASFFAGNLPPSYSPDNQCVCKIYANAYDYRVQRGKCVGDAKSKIQIIGFLSTSSIKIKSPENSIKVSLDSIWGFAEGEHEFRVFNTRAYQILATGPITIYRGIGKYYRKYYFSKDTNSTIYWFSKRNLRKVFRDNEEFLKRINDEHAVHRLLQYDACNEQFIIHHLFTKK